MKLSYSLQSILDLENILNYIAKNSSNNALLYTEFLRDKISKLSKSPFIGIECKYKKINRDCRVYIIDSYLVFYTVKSNEIIIRRVLHGSRDYKKEFKNDY